MTGLSFTLLLSRSMTQVQYGSWSIIFVLVGYFTLASGLIPFWATRFVARKKEGAVKTGFMANFIISLIAAGIYLLLLVPITQGLNIVAPFIIFLIASIQIVSIHLVTMLEGILRSVKPQAIGYGLLIEEIVKLSLGIVLILGFRQLFLGAIIAIVLASLVQWAYYIRLLASDLRQKFHWGYMKEWMKGSTANIYTAVGSTLLSFIVVLLFKFSPNGQAGMADYQVAVTFANIIGYASSISFALYPKLLAKNCSENEVALSLRTTFMFAIPLAVLTIVMPASLLTVLKPVYAEAWPALILLTVDTLIVIVASFYTNCLLGVEHMDAEGKIHLRDLVKSKIFKIFTIPYIQAAIALPIAYVFLTRLPPNSNPVQGVLLVIAIAMGYHVSTFVGLYATMHKSARLIVAWRSIGKYIFAGIVSATVVFLLPNTTTLTSTFAKAIAGLFTYAGVLLAIDKEARALLLLVRDEIKMTVRGKTNDS